MKRNKMKWICILTAAAMLTAGGIPASAAEDELSAVYDSEQAADDAVSGDSGIYTDVDRASFVNSVEDLWYEMRDEDDDAFYEESMNYLKKTLGNESYIVGQYEQFRKDDPYADSHMLKEFILSLLNDPSNY